LSGISRNREFAVRKDGKKPLPAKIGQSRRKQKFPKETKRQPQSKPSAVVVNASPASNQSDPVHRPLWVKRSRKMVFDGLLVHRFQRPAPIAEMILDAFEEEGWPERIDDPLPPHNSGREQDRLRKEIYALNHRLKNPLIRFFADGTGQGICWEPATAS
jgi:hypothetical protein